MPAVPPAVDELGRQLKEPGKQLKELGWAIDLLVAGSLARGDFILGVSDLELVAVVNGHVDVQAHETIAPSTLRSTGAVLRRWTLRAAARGRQPGSPRDPNAIAV